MPLMTLSLAHTSPTTEQNRGAALPALKNLNLADICGGPYRVIKDRPPALRLRGRLSPSTFPRLSWGPIGFPSPGRGPRGPLGASGKLRGRVGRGGGEPVVYP